MAFSDIPIRINNKLQYVTAEWWNTIRSELIAAFGTGGYISEAAPQTISSLGEITDDPAAFKPMLPISGDGGAVTAAAAPFGVSHGFTGGKELVIIGDALSETNPVTFEPADTPGGIYMQGKFVVTRGVVLHLVYFEDEDLFYKKGL